MELRKVKNKGKPWLDERGFPLSTELLKQVSKTWNERTWNRYLASIEGGLKEVVTRKVGEYDDLLEKVDTQNAMAEFNAKAVEDCINEELEEKIYKLNHFIQEHLTDRQKQVVQNYYFEGKSELEISKELRILRSAVHAYRNAALAKLRKSFNVMAISSLVEGHANFNEEKDDRSFKDCARNLVQEIERKI